MHSSIYSGVLSILSYFAILFFLCYFSIDVIYKKNPTSYFYKSFIPDAGYLYLNYSMFHFVQLLDTRDKVRMDERAWMIFGANRYIDPFLGEFNISLTSHWNYELCNDKDIQEFKEANDDPNYNMSWCIRGFYNATTKKYIKQNEPGYRYPFIAHGTGSKTLFNIGYGIFAAKCQNTSYRTNCYSLREIDKEFENILRIKVGIVDYNYDVTQYKKPGVPYFLDIKNHLPGETITMNNLNFNPVYVETDDGLVFQTSKLIKSYQFDFNEKTVYERGNSTLISAWTFLITNLVQTYTRTYPKFQESLANAGGAMKFILLVAQILNFLFNQWVIILDIQNECVNLGLNQSDYNRHISNAKKDYKNINLNFKNNNISKENKNISGSPLNYSSNSNIQIKTLNSKNNYYNNRGIKLDNYVDKKIEKESAQNQKDNKNNIKKSQNNEFKKKIGFLDYLKTFYNKKGKMGYNIELMSKFWIQKISEENLIRLDLSLYKLSMEVHKTLIRQSQINIDNLIEIDS